MIKLEYILSRFEYDSEKGILKWRHIEEKTKQNKIWNIKNAGKRAGCINKDGYLYVRLDGKSYFAHRLIWFLYYGAWPKNEIDHKNGNPIDNHIENLREATREENMQNLKLSIRNKSGYFGVYWIKSYSKWGALIRVSGKRINLGYFDDPKIAHEAYLNAKNKYHKFQPIPREQYK